MKLVTFEIDGDRHIGLVDGGDVMDLTVADPGLIDMVELIALGDDGATRVAAAFRQAPRLLLSQVRLLAPIPRPRKDIAAVGRNYLEHAHEFSDSGFDASEKQSVPDNPIFFTKAPTAVVGPDEAIDTSNDPTSTTDYEGELGVVIGRPGIRIRREAAMGHVFGYTVINDVTARDLQKRHVQWHIGKSPDTYCPMGPCLVTADEIPDIAAMWLRTRVNSELRQEAPVADLIFDIPTLIETLSSVMTLEPGDIIATGTPVGVGIGFNPPVYLGPGDVVEVAIEGIGVLRNPVV
jgi:2-keto-4-pentenoate hydratase/2-oxohepta-3-ene-1,7-dioic acid hydratase in catechol pathway